MARHPATIARVLATVLVPVALGACGGGNKKVAEPKEENTQLKQPVQAPETEEDREKKRHADAVAIIPEGSTCLPPELRSPTAPRLELAAIGAEAVVCAIDQDRTRLLGAVGCWSVDVHSGDLKYQPPAPLLSLREHRFHFRIAELIFRIPPVECAKRFIQWIV